MEAARREDEWQRIKADIPSEKEILAPANKRLSDVVPREVDISPRAYKALARLINGEKTIERIISESPLSKYEVFQALFLLSSHGLIKALQPQEKEALAEKLQRVQKTREATEVYRSLLATDPDNVRYRQALVSVLEKGNQPPALLIAEYSALLSHLEVEDRKQAYGYIDKILQLDPNHVEAHQKLFSMRAAENNRAGALTAARNWIKVCRGEGNYRAGGEFLLEVLRRYPDEAPLYHEAADLFLAADMNTEAANCLQDVARIYEQRGDLQKLLKTYELLVSIDPSKAGRLRRITAAYRKASLGARDILRTAAIATVATVVMVVGAYFAACEYLSRLLYAEVERSTNTHAEHGEFERALKTIDEFFEAFPRSTRMSTAAELRAEMQEKAERQREQEQLNQQEITDKLVTAINRAKALYRRGELPEACRVLKKTLREVDGPKLTREQQALRGELERRLKEVEAYMAAAQNLMRQATRAAGALDAENVARAHSMVRRLMEEFPLSPAAQSASLPVLVVSRPTATVDSGGKTYKTPAVVWLYPSGLARVSLHREGFVSKTLTVDPVSTSLINESLEKDAEWSFPTDGPIDAFPLEWQGAIYISNRNGCVFRLTPRGTAEWKFTVKEKNDMSGGLGAWNDVVYTGCFDGYLYILYAASGDLKKRVRCSTGPSPIAIKEAPSAASSRGTVVVNASGRQLIGVDLGSGSAAWHYPSWPAPHTDANFVGSPQVDGDRVYVFSLAGYLLEIAHDSGELLNRYPLGGDLIHSGKVVNGKAFVALRSGEVKAIDARTGKALWKPVRLEGTPTAVPTVSWEDRVLLVPLGDRNLFCLDPRSGDLRWANRGSPTGAEGVVRGRRLYIGTLVGEVICYDTLSGKKLWQYRNNGAREPEPRGITCRGLLRGPYLYQGSDDGNLYCLRVE
jgi:outer membrane protein assembly factor BamB/tetratricopeptide (TPR) repeat protein